MAITPEEEEILDGVLKRIVGMVSSLTIEESEIFFANNTSDELYEDAALIVSGLIGKQMQE